MADEDTPIKNNNETAITSSVASAKSSDNCYGSPASALRTPLPSSSVNSTANVGINSDIHYVHDGGNVTTLRGKIGGTLSAISDVVNEHLIVVRYATFSTVLLMGAYGVANTPLFYRYKHVMDIPQTMFTKRKWIHGRIVGIAGNKSLGANNGARERTIIREPTSGISSLLYPPSTPRAARMEESGRSGSSDKCSSNAPNPQIQHAHNPIVVLFRHESPMERFLTRIKVRSPSTALFSSSTPYRNLLHIELAGVSSPPSHSSSNLSASLSMPPNPFMLLDELIQHNSKVSLQLVAQRVTSANPRLAQASVDSYKNDGAVIEGANRTAICHLHYQQKNQWSASTSASLELVRLGQAWINCGGVVAPLSSVDDRNGSILNFNPSVKQLQDDAEFISELEKVEYSSWKSKAGMWSSDHNRRLRKEYTEEEERENNKWNVRTLLKRGWEWIRKKTF